MSLNDPSLHPASDPLSTAIPAEVTQLAAVLMRSSTPAISTIKNMRWKEVVAYLMQPELIERTGRIIGHIKSIIERINGAPDPTLAPAARTFLAAYMSAYFPMNVFECGTGETEVNLKISSEELLPVFEGLLVALQTARVHGDIPAELVAAYPGLMRKYGADFRAWMGMDQPKLHRRMTRALLAMHHSLLKLPADDTDSRQELQRQIEAIRRKLSDVGGQAALAEFDRDLLDNPPEQGTAEADIIPRFFLIQEGYTRCMNNAQLTFELILDPTFKYKLEKLNILPEYTSILRDPVQSFFDLMFSRLQLPEPQYDMVAVVLGHIHGSLQNLATGTAKEELEQLLATFTLETLRNEDTRVQLFRSLYSIVRTVAGSVEEFDAKWQTLRAAFDSRPASELPEATCAVVRFLSDSTIQAQIDKANERIHLLAPTLSSDTGVGFLQDSFRFGLNRHAISLKWTTEWLSGHLKGPTAQHTAGLGQVLIDNPAALEGFHRQALVGIIVHGGQLPEVLCLAGKRILDFSAQFKRLVDCATVMRVIANHITTDPAQLEELTQRLSDMVLAHSPSDPDQVTQLFHCIVQTNPWIPEPQPLLEQMLAQLDPAHDMRVTVAKRITTYWQGYDYDELNPQPMPSVYTIGNELVKVGDAISHLSKTLVRIYTPFLKMSLTTLIEKAEAEANAIAAFDAEMSLTTLIEKTEAEVNAMVNAIAFDAEADNPDMIMADPAPADLPIDPLAEALGQTGLDEDVTSGVDAFAPPAGTQEDGSAPATRA